MASVWVRVEAEPNPCRNPLEEVVLPGETVSRLVPRALIWDLTWFWAPLAQPDGEDDRGDADHDAQHGQPRSQPVGPDRLQPGAEGLEPAHQAASAIGKDQAVA